MNYLIKKYLSVEFRFMLLVIMLFGSPLMPTHPTAYGQLVLAEVIRTAIKKVVKAMDLKIQRLQNKTIWLQQVQKSIENILSKTKLDEIAQWSSNQKEQFTTYYSSLKKVKSVLLQFKQVKEISDKQVKMFRAFQRTWQILKNDCHFGAEEIQYMAKVYGGMLDESLKNIDEITALVQSYTFQMSDAERLEYINKTANKVEENYRNLLQFNQQNMLLSLQRSQSSDEVLRIKRLYNLP
ncbi:conjugal transfer protein TraI [Sphingobacterium sp. HJSM2_6]|uniref:conjugal transfer protein TraI n=1 Tax=Sphingobacterium sp. HJSM2_6 TaxID=3366264 RepID=UPI003BEB288C